MNKATKIAIGILAAIVTFLGYTVYNQTPEQIRRQLDNEPKYCPHMSPNIGRKIAPSDRTSPDGRAFHVAIKSAEEKLVINGKHVRSLRSPDSGEAEALRKSR